MFEKTILITSKFKKTFLLWFEKLVGTGIEFDGDPKCFENVRFFENYYMNHD